MPWKDERMKHTQLMFIIPLFLLTLLPGVIWFQQTGDLTLYFSHSVPDGQLLYVLSKLVGLYAFFFLMVQLLVSLSCRYQILPFHWIGKLHKVSGITVLLFASAHLLLFFSAVSVRQDSLALGLFLPNLSDFYHTHLTFGLIGLWLLLAVVVAGIIRLSKKRQYAPLIHRTYYFSAGFIYVHVLAIGTESQSSFGLALYLCLGILLVAVLFLIFVKQNQMRSQNA